MKHCKKCQQDKPDSEFNKYGLTEKNYKKLYNQPNCYICNIALTRDSRTPTSLVIDYCHSTGEVRGVLCHCCNLGLGNFKDDTEILEKAINYLKKRKL